MSKLPKFLSKLSSKQLYTIFVSVAILFLLITFLVAGNIQNLGKNSTTNSTNSNFNSQNISQTSNFVSTNSSNLANSSIDQKDGNSSSNSQADDGQISVSNSEKPSQPLF